MNRAYFSDISVAEDSSVLLEIKGQHMGFQQSGYPGAFPNKVQEKIKTIIQSPSLHLFSGTSRIGDVRVDLEREEATENVDVFTFISKDKNKWKFVLADPPYVSQGKKGLDLFYADAKPISASVPLRTKLSKYLVSHAENILWFDQCSPAFQGFYSYKHFLFLSTGWAPCRVLTWLKRQGDYLEVSTS